MIHVDYFESDTWVPKYCGTCRQFLELPPACGGPYCGYCSSMMEIGNNPIVRHDDQCDIGKYERELIE